MLLGISLEEVYEILGHDGSAIIWPNNPEPACRRGFHIQEFQDVCHEYGRLLCEIEAAPCHVAIEGDPPWATYKNPEERLLSYMQDFKGLLVGRTSANGYRHMCYWNRSRIFNPADGKITEGTDPVWPLTVDSFYALQTS